MKGKGSTGASEPVTYPVTLGAAAKVYAPIGGKNCRLADTLSTIVCLFSYLILQAYGRDKPELLLQNKFCLVAKGNFS